MSGQDPVEVTVDIAIEGCQGAEVPPHPRTRITQKVKTSTRFSEQQDRGSRGAHRAPGRSQVPRIAPTNGHAACAARTPSTLSQFLFTFIDYFLIVYLFGISLSSPLCRCPLYISCTGSSSFFVLVGHQFVVSSPSTSAYNVLHNGLTTRG